MRGGDGFAADGTNPSPLRPNPSPKPGDETAALLEIARAAVTVSPRLQGDAANVLRPLEQAAAAGDPEALRGLVGGVQAAAGAP